MTMMTYHLPLIIICVHIQAWEETPAVGNKGSELGR
jgi:hypothetical protein